MLNFVRTIQTIDAHTGGEPLRILVSGMPPVPGRNILEKRAWLKTNRDDLRQFLMNEPRRHADMYAGCGSVTDGDRNVRTGCATVPARPSAVEPAVSERQHRRQQLHPTRH
jgi:proline racemase